MPIPLDWDRPWQVWPISCVVGAAVGYAAGSAAAWSWVVVFKFYRVGWRQGETQVLGWGKRDADADAVKKTWKKSE